MRKWSLSLYLLLCWPFIGQGNERGDYLLTVAGCIHCHTKEGGEPLAGGKAFKTPFGVVYSPNISPDRQGIAAWTLGDFERALRQGQSPRGERYYPVFPYTSYRELADGDVAALYQALLQKKPVSALTPPNELQFPFNQRALLTLWQAIYLPPVQTPVAPPSDASKGAYLTNAVSHCGECHSPRDALSAVVLKKRFAGATLPSGHRAPDLRPHAKALGAWSEDDIADYLLTGRSDYTRKARDEMHEFIECCSRHLVDDDRLAIAAYLAQLPKPSATRRRGPR